MTDAERLAKAEERLAQANELLAEARIWLQRLEMARDPRLLERIDEYFGGRSPGAFDTPISRSSASR